MLLAQVLALLWSTRAEVPRQNSQTQGARHIVPLNRQRVPVRNGDVVSVKNVYSGAIFLGTPEAQAFTVMFDTGSGHVIVPSAKCRSESCTVHKQYDHERSAVGAAINHDGSHVKPGAERDQMTVAFGTGEITGQFAYDRLCLGTKSEQTLTNATGVVLDEQPGCIEMRIIAATAMSEEPFTSFSFDGIFGLGLDSLALSPEFSFFHMLSAQENLVHPSFGIFLADNDDDFSEISFGGHNPERVDSKFAWAHVAMPEHGHWQVQIKAIRIGKRTLDFCVDGQCRAVVDSGTSSIAVPVSFSDEFFDTLESSLQDPDPLEGGAVNCHKALGELVEIDIEGGTLVLGPGDYARPSVLLSEEDGEEEEAAAMAVLEGQAQSGEVEKKRPRAKCHPTLMPMDVPEPLGPKLFILGEPVLRKYYTAYDWDKKRIGFGLANHNGGKPDSAQEGDVSSHAGKLQQRSSFTLV